MYITVGRCLFYDGARIMKMSIDFLLAHDSSAISNDEFYITPFWKSIFCAAVVSIGNNSRLPPVRRIATEIHLFVATDKLVHVK